MNKAQFKQWWNHNLWFGENGRKPEPVTPELIASVLAPPTGKVWGIDISHWNIPPVDLKRMRDVYGMSFVIIKGADGSLKTKYHADHILAADQAGIPYGLYVWLYPDSKISIDAQVGTWAALYNAYRPKLGVLIDAEWTTYGGLPANPTASDLRKAHDKFKAVTGQTTITYTAAGYADAYLVGFDWSREPLWIANYGVSAPQLPKGAAKYKYWQYTNQLDGAKLDPLGNKSLDGNYYNGTKEQFAAEFGTTPPVEEAGMYELRPAGSYNVSIRAPHPDAHILGSAVGTILNGTTGKADSKYVYSADKYVNGVLRAKAGDVWYSVTAPAVGWAAGVHLGVKYLDATEIIPVVTEEITVTIQRDGWKDLVLTGKQEKLP